MREVEREEMTIQKRRKASLAGLTFQMIIRGVHHFTIYNE
jgi:hypothetical protein